MEKIMKETSGGTLKFLGFSEDYPFTVDDIHYQLSTRL
jgi:hypothetical protein